MGWSLNDDEPKDSQKAAQPRAPHGFEVLARVLRNASPLGSCISGGEENPTLEELGGGQAAESWGADNGTKDLCCLWALLTRVRRTVVHG